MSKAGDGTGYTYAVPYGVRINPDEPTRLYYECHVTIEPVFDERLQAAETLAKMYGFKIASLLMQKRAEDTPERSKYDTFMTGHDRRYGPLHERMRGLCLALRAHGFIVHRAKIEDTIFDTKHGDAI